MCALTFYVYVYLLCVYMCMQAKAGHNWLNQGGTIIDAMSTLAIMGEIEEFKRAAGQHACARVCLFVLMFAFVPKCLSMWS